MRYPEVLSYFTVVTTSGDRAMCLCPCHNDQKASLEISHENGKTLIHCHAGCNSEDVLNAVDLKVSDLFDESPQEQGTKKQTDEKKQKTVDFDWYVEDPINKVEATYDYHNPVNGEYVKTKIRRTGKQFLFGIKSGKQFTFGSKSVRDVPAVYGNLDEIKNASPETPIFVVEGEKDVDTMARKGFLALTCGGTTSLTPETKEAIGNLLEEKDVVVLADNDFYGKKAAIEVYDAVKEKAKTVKAFVPSDVPKGDISDFFAEKHSYPEFTEMIKGESQYETIIKELEKQKSEKEGWQNQLLYDDDERTKLRKILANVITILENDERFKGKLVFNEFTHTGMVNGQFPWSDEDNERWTDLDSICVKEILERDYRIGNRDTIENGIKIVMRRHGFNPMNELLKSFEYKGDGFVRQLVDEYLGVENLEYATEVFKVTMRGAIHRAFHPGCKFDTVLMLAGPQGVGKSTFFRKLALKQEYFNDSLASMDSTNAVMSLMGSWIVELAELAVFARTHSGVDGIKQFITTQVDKVRLPYARNVEEFPRHCIFVGTTNRLEFLADSTGNRRFIVVEMQAHLIKRSIVKDSVRIDELIQNAWAEVLHEYLENEDHIERLLILSEESEKIAADYRKKTELQDPMLPSVEKYLEDKGDHLFCIREIWDEVFIPHLDNGMPIQRKNPERKDSLRISGILQQLGYRIVGTRNFPLYGGKNKAFEKVKQKEKPETPKELQIQIQIEEDR